MQTRAKSRLKQTLGFIVAMVAAIGLFTTGVFAAQTADTDFVYTQSATTVSTTGGTVTLTASLPAGTDFYSGRLSVDCNELVALGGTHDATWTSSSPSTWNFSHGNYKGDAHIPGFGFIGSQGNTNVKYTSVTEFATINVTVPNGVAAGTVIKFYGTKDITTGKTNPSEVYFNALNSNYTNDDRVIFSITVTGPEVQATSVTAPDISGTVGTAITNVTATQNGGTPGGKFSAVGLPAGLALDEDTGVISGTPTTADTGTYTVTYKTPSGALSQTSAAANINIVANTQSTYKFVINAPTAMKTNVEDTNSSVQLVYNDKGTYGYDHALVMINVTNKPAGSNPIVNAIDSQGTTYNLAQIGTWGPPAGFPVSNAYDATTSFTSLKFDMSGVYTVEFSLVDKDNNDAVICSGTHTVTVNDYLISYALDGGSLAAANPSGGSAGATITLSSIPSKSGYTFKGWTSADANVTNGANPALDAASFSMPASDVTLTATWDQNVAVSVLYTLKFNTNGGTAVPPVLRVAGATISLDQTSSKSGYTFDGWYADEQLTKKLTQVALNRDTTVYAKWSATTAPEMFREDHVAYVVGYADGTVRPDANITRGETATIFFRLMADTARSSYWKNSSSFTDVSNAVWFNNAVSTMANAGFITGYTDGTFGGSKPITRAEFAVIAARANGADGKYVGADKLSDIAGHWAQGYINEAVDMGLITGYTDGTFKPNDYITRAEAITLVNRFLGRDKLDSASFTSDAITWKDSTSASWYFNAVQEATNSHEFTRQPSDIESWTSLTETPDWAALEKSWSTANSAK